MKYFLFCLFFMSIMTEAQPLKIAIEQIAVSDSLYGRHFEVNFTIENTSEDTIAFFLNSKNFIPAQGGPLANAVFYKIYQDDEMVEASGVLGTRITNAEHKQPRYMDYSKLSKDEIDAMRIRQQQEFFASMITLAPSEKRSYSRELIWHYERYQKHGDNEFYIDANKPHYFELMLIFWREEYSAKLSPEQFEAMMANEFIIKGWYLSNKMAIDFSEKKSTNLQKP